MRVGDDPGTGTVFRRPLVGARGALGQFPFEAEHVFEKVVAPLGRRGGPGHFQAAGDSVRAFAAAEFVPPAQTLFFQASRFGLGTHVVGGAGAMGLAERVTAGDQRHGFLIVHGHAAEGFTDVLAGGHRVRVAFRAFRVHIDQAHLHGRQRVFQIAALLRTTLLVFPRFGNERAFAGFLHGFLRLVVAHVTAQPFVFRAPVDILVRFPDVRPATGKAEGLEAHGFQRDVTGQDDQVGPGNLVAILLLDRPQQAAGLVQADVVGPAVERCKALLARAGAASAIACTVGARGVPGHAHEQRSVMSEVRRPPVLRVSHQRGQVTLERGKIQGLERLGVVEALVRGGGQGRVLVQDLQIQLVRPPIAVRGATTSGVIERAFRFSSHL
ncbi:hypothetical protein D3C76_820620 [compost metagenome]